MTPASGYLSGYGEAEARSILKERFPATWKHALVIPAYRESEAFLPPLAAFASVLTVLVLNYPDKEVDKECNAPLRERVMQLPRVADYPAAGAQLFALSNKSHLLLIERSMALPTREGVGLARKIGCDVALALHGAGYIHRDWIHSTDADATLPPQYFTCIDDHDDAVALTYPFAHASPADPRERLAMTAYERFLREHVRGLRDAGSPYAFHTLGSCIAVRAAAYERVRGFPRRAGGEDFYLLNKLAKHGSVATPRCDPIRLSARLSTRVPFGTGPALRRLLAAEAPEAAPLCYDDRCYVSLKAILCCITRLASPELTLTQVEKGLRAWPEAFAAMERLGFEKFLLHAQNHCADAPAFLRQFHQWMDGFRTLKLIHALAETWGRRPCLEQAQPLLPTIRDVL